MRGRVAEHKIWQPCSSIQCEERAHIKLITSSLLPASPLFAMQALNGELILEEWHECVPVQAQTMQACLRLQHCQAACDVQRAWSWMALGPCTGPSSSCGAHHPSNLLHTMEYCRKSRMCPWQKSFWKQGVAHDRACGSSSRDETRLSTQASAAFLQ